MPTVSIITLSQHKRMGCLEILIDVIKDQTYENILEWVIVEGSETAEKAAENKKYIFDKVINPNQPKTNFEIRYVEYSGLKLGGLRNLSNQSARGDIIVCMDDDDYYFPTRVEHCVDKLSNSDKLFAGCSHILIHDYVLNKSFIVNMDSTHGVNHSTNNAMAYKREYLRDHCYDYTKTFAEETMFTNNFSEPMEKLDTMSTLVLSSHDMNTYNKREILSGAMLMNFPTYQIVPGHDFIPDKYYQRYRNLFIKSTVSPYDIVYFAGGHSIAWDPDQKNLGGSEQAIIHLAKEWAKIGKTVAVYGNIDILKQGVRDGVNYINWKHFPYNEKFKVLIVWRLFGLLLTAHPFEFNADYVILDLHDNMKLIPEFKDIYLRNQDRFNVVHFKSDYHVTEFETLLGQKLEQHKYRVIPNGLRINMLKDFTCGNDNLPIVRSPYRFTYTSCYTRGLVDILEKVWPHIYAQEPRAELHVYYGMDHIKEEDLKNKLKTLLSSPGVMDHGRQPAEHIIREKYMSSFHLYLSKAESEIDCIAVRESLVTGCIPIISNFGVFANRDGIQYNYQPEHAHVCQSIANDIVRLIRNKENNVEIRKALKGSNMIIDWSEIAKRWLETFPATLLK